MLAACRGTHGRLLSDTDCVVKAVISAVFWCGLRLAFLRRRGGEPHMLTLKYLLESVGFGLLAASAALLILDYRSGAAFPRWRMAARFAALALIPLLVGISIVVVPPGMAGV